jgi:predicted transcriptional regulator
MTGGGRNRKVTRARAVLSYMWVRYLGRSGQELAKALGVTPQALYASSRRVETDNAIHLKDLARWCK